MRRKSIGNKNHFRKAVIESSKLIESGKSLEEIQNELKNDFIEHEIKSIHKTILKSQILPDLKIFKLILKLNLWILLLYKILNMSLFMFNLEYSTFFKLILFILAPSLNVISLYLIHKEKPFAYVLTMLFGIFTLQNSSTFDSLFVLPLFSLLWNIELLVILNILALIIIGFILFRKLPIDALRAKNILDNNKTNHISKAT